MKLRESFNMIFSICNFLFYIYQYSFNNLSYYLAFIFYIYIIYIYLELVDIINISCYSVNLTISFILYY